MSDRPTQQPPCEGSTIEHPNGTFEVVCSVHGHVFSYSNVDYRLLGGEELQECINEEWAHHTDTKPKPWLN